MSDLRAVLDRVETDYAFYLAILSNPDDALASYDLSEAERLALAGDNRALWNLVLREPVENGGPGPGPPPPGPPPGPPPPGPPPPGPPPPGPPPPGPPPPGPPPPGPPPPGPPPGIIIWPVPGPPPPGPPPGVHIGPVPGPPPPGPPPGPPGGIGVTPIGPGGVGIGPVPGTPPPIGIIGVIHFDVGIFQEWEETLIQEIVNDAEVITAVAAVDEAETFAARTDAIARLMEKLE